MVCGQNMDGSSRKVVFIELLHNPPKQTFVLTYFPRWLASSLWISQIMETLSVYTEHNKSLDLKAIIQLLQEIALDVARLVFKLILFQFNLLYCSFQSHPRSGINGGGGGTIHFIYIYMENAYRCLLSGHYMVALRHHLVC